ncbi:synaptosomal-associated protein 29-like [Haliotis cracherodii]|uniref:synaptosomal-associated protein 29-like n=1 Tax=Haliotis cracherodii TaxID=6455 RepID=UPI0039ED8815
MAVYQKSSNPFEDDDDGDMAFGGSSWKANQQNTSNDANERREQLMRQIDESEARQLESTRRALASIYESEDTGIQTAEELSRQAETLNNIEKKTDDVNRTLTSSQKHLNNIKSVFGGIKNWWSGSKDPNPLPPTKSEPKASPLKTKVDTYRDSQDTYSSKGVDASGFYDDNDIDSRFMAGARNTGGPRQQMVHRITNSAQEDAMDENLGLMSDGMARLKNLAMDMGDEIGRQNDQLDRINVKTDRALPRLENQNKQMKKILHK